VSDFEFVFWQDPFRPPFQLRVAPYPGGVVVQLRLTHMPLDEIGGNPWDENYVGKKHVICTIPQSSPCL